jgi:hypothetical protein
VPLANSAVACNGCGWSKPGAKKAALPHLRYGLCEHDDRGQLCAKPGSLSSSTLGSGPWFCSEHYPPFRGMRSSHTPPPAGFRTLRSALPKRPDPEGDAERAAIESETL